MENNYDKIVELYHLMNDDEKLLKVFYANDYPVPYKSLTLYPVQVDLYYYFHMLVECLLLPHKTSGDAKAISMSYLKYLCYLCTEKQQAQHIIFLSELLQIVLRKNKKYIDKDGKEKRHLTYEHLCRFCERHVACGQSQHQRRPYTLQQLLAVYDKFHCRH